jgi:predicted nucleotidyltransferase component of viral defense system
MVIASSGRARITVQESSLESITSPPVMRANWRQTLVLLAMVPATYVAAAFLF